MSPIRAKSFYANSTKNKKKHTVLAEMVRLFSSQSQSIGKENEQNSGAGFFGLGRCLEKAHKPVKNIYVLGL